MSIYYLLSGVDTEKGFQGEIVDILKKDIKGYKNFVAISSSPNDYKKNDQYFETYKKWFNMINSDLKYYELIDNRKDDNEMKQVLEQGEVILICGGDTKSQIEFIKEHKLDEILCKLNKSVIMGISAGSINMAKRVFLSKDEKYDTETQIYDGIGLVDINIEPHFDLENVDLINEIQKYKNEFDVIGLPNESSIRIDNNEIKYIGKYYKINEDV